jgi:aspartate 1-decarboxylase
MRVKMLQAKLHRVKLTQAVLDYEGSCGIDENLLDAAGMRAHQHIDIYNVSNGARFSTYIIKAPPGSGEISLNGAAARMGAVGDLLIICTYASYEESELERHSPIVITVNDSNRLQTRRVLTPPEVPAQMRAV